MALSLLIEKGLSCNWLKPTTKEEEAVESQRQAVASDLSARTLL